MLRPLLGIIMKKGQDSKGKLHIRMWSTHITCCLKGVCTFRNQERLKYKGN
jgi:hypothetical protein